ncbi:hinge domain of cleavage stimulation factor subunit 2-domain-containing protein [Geopyxis carbonaria]|nr:hinge domain of cleavage stimulation factor subunit 2-domain-containing protein [Geopyxis carbonaria]
MPPQAAQHKIVFVGNIPYGLTEEQITDIFASAGRVLSFRLVYDRDTGRPKGFGFAEYSDAETAASAVRNLNDYEIMGRKLRVDFSHDGASSPDDEGTTSSITIPPAALPELPPGVSAPPGLNAPDAISQTLKSLPVPQLLDILAQMKNLVTTDPLKATELLRAAPQLSYAVFQALLLMNLVDTSVLTQVIEGSAAAPPAAPPVPKPQPPQPVYQPQPAPTPTPQPAQPAMDPARQAMLQQVMSLTQDQISMLSVEQQQQIMLLKQQLMASGGY